MEHEKLIITAASELYAKSLFALIGSINCNWPGHPPVLVYDIGLEENTLRILEENKIPVRKVPPFCEHWRKHFTWKIWCWNDAPAQSILWMDAGVCALGSLDEIFEKINESGYFAFSSFEPLEKNSSEVMRKYCNISLEKIKDKETLSANVMGFNKTDKRIQKTLEECQKLSLIEDCIQAYKKEHRWDQALVSLLLYKHLGEVFISDGVRYGGWKSPNQVPGQKIWAHRRYMRSEDIEYFAKFLSQIGSPYTPGEFVSYKISLSSIPGRIINNLINPQKLVTLPYRLVAYTRQYFRKRRGEDRIYDGIKKE